MASLTVEENLIIAVVSAHVKEEEERRNIASTTIECMSPPCSSSQPLSTQNLKDTKGMHLPWIVQPLFLKQSIEWEELARGLRDPQCSPGGGPAVAALINRFLALWPLYLKNRYSKKSDINRRKSRKSDEMNEKSFQNEVKVLSQALETVLWEKLHIGIWKDVSLIWRDAYSFSCLLSALVELEMSSNVEERRKKALRCLDMATLMGGPLWRPRIFHFISDLVELLNETSSSTNSGGDIVGVEESKQSDKHTFTLFEQLKPQPPLPPGALGTSPLSHPVPRHNILSLETFAIEYMLPQHPVIISGAMETWPALKKWQQVEYWRRHAGPRTVPVEVGKNYMAEGWGQQLMLFSEFLDHHLLSHNESMNTTTTTDNMEKESQEINQGKKREKGADVMQSECVYLAQHDLLGQIPQLAKDSHQPEYCSLGQTVHATNTWIGPSGTVTPLHTDPEQNLLCQVVGRKYVRLYSPEQSEALVGGNLGGDDSGGSYLTMNTSPVDVDTHPLVSGSLEKNQKSNDNLIGSGNLIDKEGEDEEESGVVEYALYASAPFLDCILESGEMLYIPAGWWHYVKSLSTSASVNFWWKK